MCADISYASVWSYVNLWVSNKSDFWWRHLLSLCLKLSNFMRFKQKWILMKTLVESQFEVFQVYEFQTRANFLWINLLSLSLKLGKFMSFNKSEFWWINLLSLSLNLCKFMNFKQKGILMKTFGEAQFEVI